MPDKNQIVRWGVMSTARIATKVRKAIQQTEGAKLSAVASRSADRAAAWAKEHGADRSYGDYQALLDDDELDAIYIPLPPSMHAEWTIRAAQHGKHVLCEKPLAMNVAEAEEMAAACREHKVQLMDAVMWVHHPRAADMRRPIEDGRLGKLRRVTSGFTFHWDEVPLTDIRMQRELGGGSLMDLGWYCVRATMWATGALPTRVYGTARYVQDVDMNFSAVMWYDGDIMASFDCGFDVGWRKWFEVAGTHGSLVCDDFVNPWDSENPRYWLHGAEGKLSEHVSAPPIQEQCMIEEFCRIVRSSRIEERWPADSIANQRVCDALASSARTGTVVGIA